MSSQSRFAGGRPSAKRCGALEGGNMPRLFETAKMLAKLVEERAKQMNVPITISVVDAHGNLVLTHRREGARLISIEMSERKAYTSALTFMATKDITPLAQPGERMHTITDVAG